MVAGLGLAWVAFALHPVGDYFTESDFYAGYVAGARGIQQGRFDFGRYGAYGPLYELALAAVSWATRDLFVSARAISVASAIAVLATSWAWARRRLGDAAAAWLVALLAVNPTFFRYGYSAGTDMLSFACFSLGLALLLVRRDVPGALAGGAAAGAAALTRYNLASLFPGALVVWLARRPWRVAGRGAAAFALAFLAVVGAFTIPSIRSGHRPGATLLHDAGFYLEDAPATRLEERYGGGEPAPPSAAPAQHLALRALTGLATHAREDAMTLLGWPVAALVLIGLAWLLATRAAGPLAELAPPFAAVFLPLAPVFYTERYSMVLLPLELAPAALALGRAMERRRGWLAVPLGAAALLMTAVACFRLQRLEQLSIPVETLAAGRAIHARAHAGDRVLARKAHVAFAAGLEPVLFPDVRTIVELGEFCRRERVRFLYFSWYELRLRPQFGFLLDTSAVVPGLTPIHATVYKPEATYRVGPELGATPAWWRDPAARDAIRARVNALIARATAETPP